MVSRIMRSLTLLLARPGGPRAGSPYDADVPPATPTVSPAVVEGLTFQQAAFTLRSLSSPLYHCLVTAALLDLERDGPVASVFAEVPPELDPIPDAVTLR